jgi:hypothetical protein
MPRPVPAITAEAPALIKVDSKENFEANYSGNMVLLLQVRRVR